MKKFFRLFFSRVPLILLAIILQIGIAVVFTMYFRDYYFTIRVITTAVLVLVLLGIINRDMSAEGKLPWAIIVTLFPILGVILYFSFSRNYASHKERKLFAKLPQLKFANEHPQAPDKIAGQINYLKQVGAPCFSNAQTKFFKCGEEFLPDLLEELEKAHKFIFMEYFIVENGKMFDSILEILKRKVEEGVEVRLMYDYVGSSVHVGYSFFRKLKKSGINCVRFGKLKPIISAVYNNRDHRKITVIDGIVGYTGGINLADEYINETHPFGYWKDTAVKIVGESVSSLCVMFLQMFSMARNKTENFDKYIDACKDKKRTEELNSAENPARLEKQGIIVPFGDGPKPIYSEYIGRSVYINLINQSEKELCITTPYLIVDDEFTEALRRAAMRGVNVNIIIPAVPDKKSVYAMTKQGCAKLVKSGVKIYLYSKGFIHAKGIVSDGVAGVVGTINLDYRSFVHHYECGAYMFNTVALSELRADIMQVINESELLLEPPRLKLSEKFTCIFANLFRPML